MEKLRRLKNNGFWLTLEFFILYYTIASLCARKLILCVTVPVTGLLNIGGSRRNVTKQRRLSFSISMS